MSLVCWLPLNGDLRNLGCSPLINVNVQSGVSVDNNGKIGKCYTNTGTNAPVASSLVLTLTRFSACAWVKINAKRSGWQRSFGMKGDDCYFGLGCEHTNGTSLGFHCYKNVSGTNTGVFDTYPTTVQLNTWVHYAMVYDATKYYIYENGILIASGTPNQQNVTLNMTSLYIFGGHGSGYLSSSLNDIRIYDHALSAAEVREISLGLVLHYKLDGGIYGNPNLVDGSNTASTSTNTWNFSMQVGDKTNTIEYEDGVPIVVITRGTTELSGWCFLSYNNFRRNEIKTSTTYTVSFDIKSVLAGTISFTGFLQSNATNRMTNSATAIQGVVTANEWSHIVLLCTTIADFSDITIGSQIVYMSPSTSLRATGNIMKFKNIKVEEGTIETVWCPSNSEGIDRSKIEDSSGYNYNGTILGNPIISSDTVRYISSTSFPANADGILSTYPLTLWNNAFTYSFWIKPSGENGGRSIYAASYSGTSCSIEKTTGNKLRFYWNGSPDLSTSSLTITDGIWLHIAVVKEENKTTVKCYYNGVLKDTFTNTFNDKTFSGNLRIARDTRGDATSYTGMMSDFRIYCTALDADAIRQLYEVGAKIDNKNNIHSFELNENNLNEITKTGILKCSTFSEFNRISFLKYDPNLYIEPDGSCWVRVFHHNNPESVIFASSDTFTTSVYKDADRWFNMELCNYLDKWEIIVKGKLTSTSTEYKIRWSLPANPMTCAYTDVTKDKVTWNTNGYNTVNSTWGGLFKKNSGAYLVADNNTSGGNWWGAVGAFGRHQGGIPGYGGGVTTTGYEDVYLRIDNVTFSNAVAKNTKNKIWTSAEFIEL